MLEDMILLIILKIQNKLNWLIITLRYFDKCLVKMFISTKISTLNVLSMIFIQKAEPSIIKS